MVTDVTAALMVRVRVSSSNRLVGWVESLTLKVWVVTGQMLGCR